MKILQKHAELEFLQFQRWINLAFVAVEKRILNTRRNLECLDDDSLISTVTEKQSHARFLRSRGGFFSSPCPRVWGGERVGRKWSRGRSLRSASFLGPGDIDETRRNAKLRDPARDSRSETRNQGGERERKRETPRERRTRRYRTRIYIGALRRWVHRDVRRRVLPNVVRQLHDDYASTNSRT